jgi:ATP-dependent RNA helicase DDX47/RRP3
MADNNIKKHKIQHNNNDDSTIKSNDAIDSKGLEDSSVSFSSLGLVSSLVESCEQLKWRRPTQIQREVLPHALAGRDIIGLAETGSGKTGAFALPILQELLANPQPYFGLILAPTRELAFQISEQIEALGSIIGVRCCSIVGGVDMIQQSIALAKKPHIIVASPGRIVDHLENTKGFRLDKLKFLVLDEADRLLNMDFEKEIDKLLQVIPKQRRTYLFSATMTNKVAKLQRASLADPVKIEVSKKYQTAAGLRQQYLFIPAKYKDVYLCYILNELSGNTSIIFTSTCEHTQRVAIMLRNLGFSAIPLHGKMTQPKRLGALNQFKSGSMNILIATDVASRGLDIPSVDLVINYDIPQHSKDYIHRVGRTARAGRSGRGITLVTQYDVELFQRIEQLLGYKLEELPTEQAAVMLLADRVAESQRIAAIELREAQTKNKGKYSKYDQDEEEEGRNTNNSSARVHHSNKSTNKRKHK